MRDFLFSGEVASIKIGPSGVEAAFNKLQKNKIYSLISKVLVFDEPVISGNVDRLGYSNLSKRVDFHVKNKTEGLILRLGSFHRPTVKLIERVTKYSYLKYIIIEDKNGAFLGIATAREISTDNRVNRLLLRWLSDSAALRNLPNYISATQSLHENTDILTAFRQMESLDADMLPVIDANVNFVGVVFRSKLASSIIRDLLNQIN